MASGCLTPPFGHALGTADVCDDGAATPKGAAGILHEPSIASKGKFANLLGEKLLEVLHVTPVGDEPEGDASALPMRPPSDFATSPSQATAPAVIASPAGILPPLPKVKKDEFMKVSLPEIVLEQLELRADEVQMVAPPKVHPVPRPPRQNKEEVRAAAATAPALHVISRGSVGHPTTCAPACKYVKRKGGCRDGADCMSCHECFWIRDGKKGDGEGTAEEKGLKVSEVVTQAPELSVGTLGHPYKCSKPCKYVRRKGGCMHGAKCTNCHQCQWRRGLDTEENVNHDNCEAAEDFGELDGKGNDRTMLVLDELVAHAPEVTSVPILSTQPEVLMPLGAPGLEPMVPDYIPYVEGTVPPSVGSVGHPSSCGPACKYAMKPKGCKDGMLCSHCHLCRWNRYGPKTMRL
eukprot:TRINITY_DN78275_c0_g1_i1.p1 TRINITY_DN78275_c0_g1~~TRINITY_DN78275_c0_g1_i1.p1  ORF type:complete len:406 (+),score=74.72 TRINITY_DN78275_c0_g1_i1:135-1352(+)